MGGGTGTKCPIFSMCTDKLGVAVVQEQSAGFLKSVVRVCYTPLRVSRLNWAVARPRPLGHPVVPQRFRLWSGYHPTS